MIKIVTAWSNPGGSTIAFINLCNAFNKRNIDCTLYGPHEWHLNKCKALPMNKLEVTSNDHVISHFCALTCRNKPIKHILSVHEKDLFRLDKIHLDNYNSIHMVSNNQKKWHLSNTHIPKNTNIFICPNVVEPLLITPLPETKVAGIIGSIDKNKQTHISINRAIKDNITDIRIFGNITDQVYYHNEVLPLIKRYNVKMIGHVDNKQKIYDQISDVYLSSLSETWSFVKVECEMSGRNFHGTSCINGNHDLNLTEEEIISVWKKQLSIN